MGGEHYRTVTYTGEMTQALWDDIACICERYKDKHPISVTPDLISIPSEQNTINIKRHATFSVKWQDFRYGDRVDPLKDLANELMDFLRLRAPAHTVEDSMDWRQDFFDEFALYENSDAESDKGGSTVVR